MSKSMFKKRHTFDCVVINRLFIYLAKLEEKIKKNCLDLAPVAPMPQKVTGARHPWHPSLRGP